MNVFRKLTNNDIRLFLGLPRVDYEFQIDKVDKASVGENTLMFINKLGMNLEAMADFSVQCVYLVEERFYSTDIRSRANDFIFIRNPKYEFCRIVEKYKLKSRLQEGFKFEDGYRTWTPYCKEIIIGENCQIDSGAIIGGTDFSPVIGNSREELVQFPQLGGVKIGDNVLVKYNTMIGKGTFEYTEIGDNTMIDFGCQIGHNCIIGKSCIIAAGTIIGGSTVIGDCTTIGIGAKIRNGLHIGRNVSIGMGAVVVKDIPDDCVVVGNPARVIEHKTIFDEGGLV